MAHVVTHEQTLSSQQRSLYKENKALRVLIVLEAAVAGGFLIGGFAIRLAGGSVTPLVIGVVIAFLAASHFYKQKQNLLERKRIAAGQRGEARISQVLEEELSLDCYVLNDTTISLGRQKAQVDHLVAGPKGIFIFETKNWAGHLSGSPDAHKWTQVRRRDAKPIELSNPVRQVTRQTDFVKRFLASKGYHGVRFHPSVVLMNPRTTWDVESLEVPLLRPSDIPDFVFAMPPEPRAAEEEVIAWVRLFAGEGSV